MLGPEDSSVGCTAHRRLSRPNGHQRPPTLQASASQAVLVGAGVGASQQGTVALSPHQRRHTVNLTAERHHLCILTGKALATDNSCRLTGKHNPPASPWPRQTGLHRASCAGAVVWPRHCRIPRRLVILSGPWRATACFHDCISPEVW